MTQKTIAENVILIGEKPFMAYMKSVNTLFRGKGLKDIEIKARGKNIKKAVDVAAMVAVKIITVIFTILGGLWFFLSRIASE